MLRTKKKKKKAEEDAISRRASSTLWSRYPRGPVRKPRHATETGTDLHLSKKGELAAS